MSDTIHVAVAVIVNDSKEVCISLRHKGTHQGGLWEFPGGKIEPDETVEQALAREIKEELDLDVLQSRCLIKVFHDYQDRKVCLHVHKVLLYEGQVCSNEGQDIKWVDLRSLTDFDFPAANLPIIKALQLPDRYLITGKFSDHDDFIHKLNHALENGIELVQLRLKNNSMKDISQAQILIEDAVALCKQAGAKLMLNLSVENIGVTDLHAIDYSGIHADSKTLKSLSQDVRSTIPVDKLFSASCHNIEELNKAVLLNADFAVLSPVQKTASHPDMDAMGWQKFSEIVEKVPIPVFALGGVSEKDMETSWLYGGQGVAAISAFWNQGDLK